MRQGYIQLRVYAIRLYAFTQLTQGLGVSSLARPGIFSTTAFNAFPTQIKFRRPNFTK